MEQRTHEEHEHISYGLMTSPREACIERPKPITDVFVHVASAAGPRVALHIYCATPEAAAWIAAEITHFGISFSSSDLRYPQSVCVQPNFDIHQVIAYLRSYNDRRAVSALPPAAEVLALPPDVHSPARARERCLELAYDAEQVGDSMGANKWRERARLSGDELVALFSTSA